MLLLMLLNMAAKYSGSFVSKTEIEKKKESKRSYLETELEEARSKFEARKRSKELKEQRGETKWMLPSLSKRIRGEVEQEDSVECRKKKKKHEKKSKKHKKEKKSKKHKSKEKRNKKEVSSESSDAATGDEWVEKDPVSKNLNTTKNEVDKHEERVDKAAENVLKAENPLTLESSLSYPPKREDWMMSSSLLDYVAGSSEARSVSRAKKEEERREKEKSSILQPGQHPRELNPHWKQGGTGLPSEKDEKQSDSKSVVGDAGRTWVHRAYQRAKEQAEDEGRKLEDIVAERWGSMEKLNALLKASDRRDRPSDDQQRRSGWRKENARSGWRKEISRPSNDETSGRDGKADNQSSLTSKSTEQEAQIAEETAHVPSTSLSTETRQRKEPSNQKATMDASKPRDSDSSESENSEYDSESVEEHKTSVAIRPLSENEINEISAKILRAELLGNQELVNQLKVKLEAGRNADTGKTDSVSAACSRSQAEEEEIVLTRTDKHGNVYPLKVSGEETESGRKRKKLKKIETHDAKGNRLRYHQMDDSTDLKSMIEEERLTTAEDHQKQVLSRLSGKLGNTMGDYYTLDDMFETSSANKESRGSKDEKAKKRAISEHHKAMAVHSKCRFCFENPDIAKHLIISIASHVYIALPKTASLTEGHCLIVPMQHILASTYLDEDLMQEVTMFKTSLVEMFREKDEDVIFLETFKSIKRQYHMFIECIPVPKEIGDMAPIYFKKAIQESETEWAQNKKVVEIVKNKGIMKAIPKGLPYFSVEFGLDGGFGHVIEDEESFEQYFGKAIIGGMLDLEPNKWRNPHKETFQQHKRKVLNFSDNWQAHDWTRNL